MGNGDKPPAPPKVQTQEEKLKLENACKGHIFTCEDLSSIHNQRNKI
jgi:hypothetical protein